MLKDAMLISNESCSFVLASFIFADADLDGAAAALRGTMRIWSTHVGIVEEDDKDASSVALYLLTYTYANAQTDTWMTSQPQKDAYKSVEDMLRLATWSSKTQS